MNREQRRAAERKGELVLPPGTSSHLNADATPTVAVGFCHAHDGMTPQFRRCLTFLYQLDARGREDPWIVGEYDHEASGVHVPDARCAIVQKFLDDPLQPEWLAMFDVDATFAPDILDRYLAVADPKTAPIVGALAFGVAPATDENGVELYNSVLASEQELFPTVYFFNDDGGVEMMFDYPRDQLVQVHSTGCHAFIVHRSVLADPRWKEDGHPLPWFRVAVLKGRLISEDQFFFAKAGALGYPIHVDTSIKTGHVKTYVADEDLYQRQRAQRAPLHPDEVGVE